jgi:hypothetical protein
MLFEKRLRDGLADGTISVAFRRWRGRRWLQAGVIDWAPGRGWCGVESVDVVPSDAITTADARAAGFGSVADVLKDLGSADGVDALTYRIGFGPVSADPRDQLRDRSDELDALAQRVQRIHGADATLAAIGAHPALRAGDLMVPLGWTDLHHFKLHVRRLKDLGLAISLPVGYRLSPRGEAYLARRAAWHRP